MLSMVIVLGDGVSEVHGLMVGPVALVVGVVSMLVLTLLK
jgi:hypothetical protein